MKKLLILSILSFLYIQNSFSQDSTKTEIKLQAPFSVPNTHVTFQPPQNFQYSEKIKGFVHPGSAASVVITEAEGISWLQVCEKLTSENLNGQNVTLTSQEDIQLSNGITGRFYVMRILLISNDSTRQDIEFERLMLFAGDYHRTIWMNANYPALLNPVLYATLKESMLSAIISDTLIPAENEK